MQWCSNTESVPLLVSNIHDIILVHTQYILVCTCLYYDPFPVPVCTWYVLVHTASEQVHTKYPIPVMLFTIKVMIPDEWLSERDHAQKRRLGERAWVWAWDSERDSAWDLERHSSDGRNTLSVTVGQTDRDCHSDKSSDRLRVRDRYRHCNWFLCPVSQKLGTKTKKTLLFGKEIKTNCHVRWHSPIFVGHP